MTDDPSQDFFTKSELQNTTLSLALTNGWQDLEPSLDWTSTKSARLATSSFHLHHNADLFISAGNQTCGYAVPYYQFLSHRTQLMTWAARKEAKDHELAEITKKSSLQSDQHPVPSAIDEHAPINPDGMKQWWQSHNLLSLDGLPAFSVNLGRGFPFSSLMKPTKNGKAPETSSARSALSVQSNSSSLHIHMGTPPKNSPPASWSQIQTHKNYLRLSFPHHDILLLVPRLYPYLIVLFIGIFIGRISNYSRNFAALGLWRDVA